MLQLHLAIIHFMSFQKKCQLVFGHKPLAESLFFVVFCSWKKSFKHMNLLSPLKVCFCGQLGESAGQAVLWAIMLHDSICNNVQSVSYQHAQSGRPIKSDQGQQAKHAASPLDEAPLKSARERDRQMPVGGLGPECLHSLTVISSSATHKSPNYW